MNQHYDIVVLGLSLSSSWGNGHATTWRALLRGAHALGARILFLERDVPWYAENRDLAEPDFCRLELYRDLDDLERTHRRAIQSAGAVIVGSYVPDGVAVLDFVTGCALGAVAFYDIDTPITLAALDAGTATYIAPRQIPLLDVYLSFSAGPVLKRLQREYGALKAVGFHCAVDEVAYCPRPAERRWDLGYLGTYSPDRQPTLERLLLEPARRMPDRRFVVAGPQYPGTIAWPANVERIEHLPPADHPAFYASQRYTLNVTRRDMIAAGWSPSVRLFEAAACGTPIISDEWPGLTQLFPEKEAILIGRSTEDVVAALGAPAEGECRRIAAHARRRILAHHTGRVRARQLLAIISAIESRIIGSARQTRAVWQQTAVRANAGVSGAL